MKLTQLAAELLDREAIREVQTRYARGVDRADIALLRSAFWEDATDNHGHFSGLASEFIDYLAPRIVLSDQMAHLLGNMFIEIDGDAAAVETYFQAFHRVVQEDGSRHEFIIAGRYLDRMEKRQDEWKIAAREVAYDWYRDFAQASDWAAPPRPLPFRKNRFPDDRSYRLLREIRGS